MVKIKRKKLVRKIYKDKTMTHCYDNGKIVQYLYSNSRWYKLPTLKRCTSDLSEKLGSDRRILLDTYKDTNESFNILLSLVPENVLDMYIRKTKIDKITQKIS